MRPRSLERDGGVPLCGGLPCVRRGAPPSTFARPLLAHYTGLSCGHGATPDDPPWEGGCLVGASRNPPAGPGTGGGPLAARNPGCHSRHGERLRSPCQGAGEEGGQLPSAAVSHRRTRAAALRGSRMVSPAGDCEAPMRNPPAGACGGGNRPQRSLLAGRSGLWRGAAPQLPRASAQSRRPLSMRRLRRAARPPIEPWPLGGRWRAASCTAWR